MRLLLCCGYMLLWLFGFFSVGWGILPLSYWSWLGFWGFGRFSGSWADLVV